MSNTCHNNISTAYEYYVAHVVNGIHYEKYAEMNKSVPKHDFGIDVIDPINKKLY